MNNRELYLFVEGVDDERFFEIVIKPQLQKKHGAIKIIKYAAMKKDKINSFIKSIKSMGADYIYVTDINNSPCVTAKKNEVQIALKNIDSEKIAVIIREIESWYLAGLDLSASRKLKIPNLNTTDNITKEQFNNLIQNSFDSRIDFMIEALKMFSVETARNKNKSFNYFISKFDCIIQIRNKE
ncbi:MAG: hypothetical protein QXK47_04340 [Candidatus Bathyarchaeia archaeon]